VAAASPHGRDLLGADFVAIGDALPFDDLDSEVLERVRGFAVPAAPPLSDAVQRSDHLVPGEPDVPVRVHRALDAGSALPCIYSMHGGGYVLGSYDMDDARFDAWCPELGIVGVSVEYRLAPEAPYPLPLDDCYRGLVWTFEHAEELGIDPERIGVAGVSAGGGLAAALALLARDQGEVAIAFQLLDCPMLDDRQVTPSSRLDQLAVWSRGSNEFGWRAYLGDLYGRDDVPYTAAPARASDLSGLPPAFVSVGTADGFRDEDILYAMRLNQAGVPTELHVYPGAPHGYQLVASSAVAAQSSRDVADWLTRRLGD
jgi:acetyl esterase/lipase